MANIENAPDDFATEADTRLWAAIDADNPSIDEVQAAIAAGGNVNSTNTSGESLLQWAVGSTNCSLDILQSLLDAEADINHEDPDGFTPLAESMYSHNPAIVAFLLRHGADPNSIVEKHESLLDWAEFDLFYHSTLATNDEKNQEQSAAMVKIVELLKSAGAKSRHDMVAERPRKWLQVFAAYSTGLFTRDGMLECERLPNVTQAFCNDFRDWKDTHFDTWPYKSFDAIPAAFDRAAHNAEGRRLAQEIKRLVGDAIDVQYLCLCSESENKQVRNVLTESVPLSATSC
jgi:hypothetical protein